MESGILPEGTLQLLCGSARGLLDHLTEQDLLGSTGSTSTAQQLRAHPNVMARSVRFNAEADSLNCSILGPDATPGSRANADHGAFISPLLVRCDDAGRAEPHEVQAFGPVSTVMGYSGTDEMIMAHRCPCSSTAARAGPAAARSRAVSGACRTTCSA